MTAFKKNKSLWLVFLAFFIRIIFLFSVDNTFVGDATARLYQAFLWANTITISFDNLTFILNPHDWLPMHFYLMGSAITIFGDTVYIPRLISLIFGTATIFPLYKLVKLLFNKQSAFIAILLFSLYPAHIYVSILTISESIFVFFTVNAIYYCLKYLRDKDTITLTIVTFSIAFSTLLRYEGWLLATIITAVLILSKPKLNLKNILLIAVPFFSILFIMTLLYFQGFSPLKGIIYSDFEISNYFDIVGRNYTSQIKPIFFRTLIWGSIISYIYYLVNFKKQPTINKKYILIFSIIFGAYLYKILNFSLVSVTRYFVYYQILLLPFLSHKIYNIWYNSIKHIKLKKILIIIILFINIATSFTSIYILKETKHPEGFWSTVKYIKSNIKHASFIIDQGKHNVNHDLMAHSRIFENDTSQALYSNYRESGEYWKEYRREEIEILDASLQNSTHLILLKKGNLERIFNLDNNNNKYKNYSFTPIFKKGDITIYEIRNNF